MNKLNHVNFTFVQHAFGSVLRGLIVLATLLAIGCTSNIEKVGEKHKTAAQKWKAMAEYADSELPSYGYTITAEIKLGESGNQPRFELDKFKFDLAEQASTVDLLRPEFDFKFVCKKTCIQLTEYIKTQKSDDAQAIDNIEEGSFLAKQLKQYEFQLFDFYAKLFLLNENIQSLANSQPEQFSDYLYYLVEQKTQKSTPQDFVSYATRVLSKSAFEAFLTDPVAQQVSRYNRAFLDQKFGRSTIASKHAVTPSLGWISKEQVLNDGIVSTDSDVPAEIADIDMQPSHNDGILLMTAKTQDEMFIESLNFSAPNPESRYWQGLTSSRSTTSFWDKVRDLPISSGSSVCSYNENYFGVVKLLEKSSVLVQVNGKAKQYTDGVLKDIAPGSLFRSGSDIEFLPMSEEIYLDRHSLAPCKIL
ncbi:hypothetical protein [Paraglaciecola aestuariivivens]